MKMKTKRLAAIGLTVLIGMGVFSGCGKSPAPASPETSSGAESAASREEGSIKPSDTDNTITVGIQTNSMITDYKDNLLTQYVEETMGITIDIYELPEDADECRTKISLMVASGEDMPDVLFVDGILTSEMIQQYGTDGIFLDITDISHDTSKMPNYCAIDEKDKAVMENAQIMSDGKMYSFSRFQPSVWNQAPNKLFINQKWIDTLGLEVPTTTEELKNVLIQFRDNDPNGNGKQDEIGVYGYQSGAFGENVLASLMNSFIFWNGGTQNGGLSISEDGSTVIAPFATEEWKNGLIYLKDLYDENLLSAGVFTDDTTIFKATLNEPDNVVGLVSAGSLSNWPEAKTNKNYLEMKLIKPLEGPDGVAYTPFNVDNPRQEGFIFANTDKLDLAIKFIDNFYSYDTTLFVFNSAEDKYYTTDPEECRKSSEVYGHEIKYVQTGDFWGSPSNATWRTIGPSYYSVSMQDSVGSKAEEAPAADDPTYLNPQQLEWYYPAHPENTLPIVHYNEEEAGTIQEALTNIPSFVNQAMAEFITGTRNIDTGWDSYLEELDSMGLQEWLDNAQTAYERQQ